ncbi:hypothetical protein GCM10011515_25590 [Tsuneonella deserti]|uniref:N-acetyltransferase domain-containing protein n=2 Tax=Tsuneonella deserti TaxID=2035528 RepID=A0ABQ1SAZ7_9SPHN|nr:hypothetical protein GCM10011515_25590 [Tsuneonella deserti]
MQPEAVRRYLGATEPSTPDLFTRLLRNAGSWTLYGYGSFVVRERGQARIIANLGIFHSWRGLGADFDDRPEAGWILAESHFGKGVASEAMTAVLGWFDEVHGKREIVAMIDPENAPSIALAGKLGFGPTRRAELPDTGEEMQLFARRR